MKIQSRTDVITNSSSEVFIIRPKPDQTIDELLEELESVHQRYTKSGEDNYSGDVQDIVFDGYYKHHKKVYWPRIHMDWGFKGTERYIKENYHVQKIEYCG